MAQPSAPRPACPCHLPVHKGGRRERPLATSGLWVLAVGTPASRVTKHEQAYGMRVKEDTTPGGAMTSSCPLSAAPPCPWASFSFRPESGSVTGEVAPALRPVDSGSQTLREHPCWLWAQACLDGAHVGWRTWEASVHAAGL